MNRVDYQLIKEVMNELTRTQAYSSQEQQNTIERITQLIQMQDSVSEKIDNSTKALTTATATSHNQFTKVLENLITVQQGTTKLNSNLDKVQEKLNSLQFDDVAILAEFQKIANQQKAQIQEFMEKNFYEFQSRDERRKRDAKEQIKDIELRQLTNILSSLKSIKISGAILTLLTLSNSIIISYFLYLKLMS